MLNEYTEVEESKLPSLTAAVMQDYGAELGKEFDRFDKARRILAEEIWPACDEALMAIRADMPFIPTMKMIDNGMLGEPDVRNAIKAARDNLMQACLPTDESWLEPASMNEEDSEGDQELVKEFMISKTRDADLRDTCQIVFDQLFTRGITALGVRWETLNEVHYVDRALVKAVRQIQEDAGLTDEEGEPVIPSTGKVKAWKSVFDAPITYPINMYHLWLDPTTDLGGKDREQSFIQLVFKTKKDLKGSRSKDGKNLYDHEVLEEVIEWTYQQYYAQHPKECQTTKLMGVDPSVENDAKMIPVYIFYRQIRQFEIDESTYVDRFFYVARSGSGTNEWKIIRIQDNPYKDGCKPFYVMALDPYLDNPYGVSLAEKALSSLKAKNIIEAISLNARVLQLFPPSYYAGGVLKDDRKPKLIPAGMQEIHNRAGIGMDWIKPFPNVMPQNVEIGMQTARYYGMKIYSATGQQAPQLMSDPASSMEKNTTATEVRQETMEKHSSTQVVVDRVNDKLMFPVTNCIYKLSQQNYTEEQKFITKDQLGTPTAKKISPEVLGRDRQITIVGRRGLANKAHATQNAMEALKILSNPQAGQVIQNLPLMLQDILFKIMAGLGIQIKKEYRATPEEIFAKEPAVMIAAIQNALQNPEMRQQIAEALMQSPEGQQFINEVHQQGVQTGQAAQQGQKSGGGSPPAKPPGMPPMPKPQGVPGL